MAYRVQGDQVSCLAHFHQVPVITTTVNGQVVPVELMPGEEHDDFAGFTLPLLVNMATRCTPWATWFLSPDWTGRKDTVSGSAWPGCETAILRTVHDPVWSMMHAHHEAWHLAEELMCSDLLGELDHRLGTGPAWPGDYWSKPVERRARAFAAFAAYAMEGGRFQVQAPGTPLECDLFWHVLSGGFGDEIMAMRAPKPVARPGLLARARTLLAA